MGNLLNGKRSYSEADLDSDDIEQNAPKRQKLSSTTEYIYKTLFIDGESSDITISALGKEWRLHKVYLNQAGYFSHMFNGSWREATMDHIKLDIPDTNITIDALDFAFGSLYRDDIVIDPSDIIDLAATAVFFSLDGLMKQCGDIMLGNIRMDTVVAYYEASQLYGYGQVSDTCVQYLLRNLLPHLNVKLLKDIGPELLLTLVQSADLHVMQVEVDVYMILRRWLFLQIVPGWDGSMKDLEQDTNEFIKSEVNVKAWSPSFLETPDGASYVEVFSKVRIRHIITDHRSAKVLEDDCIIPMKWILSCYREQWLQMIQLNSSQDLGPEKCEAKVFESASMRCGRMVPSDGQYCWRWVGFNYGIDVLITCIGRRIFLKRNTDPSNCNGAIGRQLHRHIVYRITVTSSSVNSNSATSKVFTTGIQQLSMKMNQEFLVLTVDDAVNFPLQISCNFLYYTPQATIGTTQRPTAVTIP